VQHGPRDAVPFRVAEDHDDVVEAVVACVPDAPTLTLAGITLPDATVG
jgi:hypothetical protein